MYAFVMIYSFNMFIWNNELSLFSPPWSIKLSMKYCEHLHFVQWHIRTIISDLKRKSDFPGRRSRANTPTPYHQMYPLVFFMSCHTFILFCMESIIVEFYVHVHLMDMSEDRQLLAENVHKRIIKQQQLVVNLSLRFKVRELCHLAPTSTLWRRNCFTMCDWFGPKVL